MTRLILLALSLFAFPGLALAQQPGRIDHAEMMRRMQDPAAMERMMKEAEAAQQCMAGIDRAKLEALEQRGRKMSNEIERLCEAGKKDEALKKALAFGREMRDDATVKKLRECSKGMTEMMQGMPWAQMPGVKDEPEPTDDDICS